MPESFKTLMQYVIESIEFFFAEVSLFLFLIGLVFFLLGLVILSVTLYVRITAQQVNGKVIGALKDVRVKEKVRDGKSVKEDKVTYHAVYEYVRPDGSMHREKGSNGGNSVLKYQTGQAVKLLVVANEKFDDVYDANDKSSIIVGGVMFLIGAVLVERAATLYASLSIGILSIVFIVISFLYKFLTRKKPRKKSAKTQNHYKEFDPAMVRPVEELAREVV